MPYHAMGWWVLAAVAASVTATAALCAMPSQAAPIDYDIVYVRAPRFGDTQNSLWPDTVRPLTPDGGATLMLLHPNGSEELLFPRPEHAGLVDGPIAAGSVADPNVSFDGQRVVFAYHHDRSDVNSQRGSGGAATGLSYLQVVNPPFMAALTTGADPDGGFVLHVP